MSVEPKTRDFKAASKAALDAPNLQAALQRPGGGLAAKRTAARALVPEFEAMRDAARDIKNHTLAHLDAYLEHFEAQVQAAGGQVHWASTAEDARQIILEICDAAKGDKPFATVNKGKSIVSEEVGLNGALEAAGHTVVETDLGEYIIQLRGEIPSHMIAPAIHVTKAEVEAEFRKAHGHLDPGRTFPDGQSLVKEARTVLREKYFAADVGVTGANFMIAETGQTVIVTNEGNGDLTQSLAKTHVVIASIEKIVPTLEDAAALIRVLARSATGQASTVYTTFSRGPRRAGDPDGPEAFHVVILDNGRTDMLGGEFEEMLRCIRCGACMNHCPVYQNIGGHAYGWVYVGPMGAVLTPQLLGVEAAGHLPNASTFCGRCEAVCPVRIPLPKLMRRHRIRQHEAGLSPAAQRWGVSLWKIFATRPALYHFFAGLGMRAMALMGRRKGRFRALPLAGGWTDHRDFPAPEGGGTFQAQWAARQRAQGGEARR